MLVMNASGKAVRQKRCPDEARTWLAFEGVQLATDLDLDQALSAWVEEQRLNA